MQRIQPGVRIPALTVAMRSPSCVKGDRAAEVRASASGPAERRGFLIEQPPDRRAALFCWAVVRNDARAERTIQ